MHAYAGWYEDNWFEVNLEKEGIECTEEQMRKAAEGHLTTEALMWNQNNQRTISGMVRTYVRTSICRSMTSSRDACRPPRTSDCD